MLSTQTIKEFDCGLPATHAFRIVDGVTRDDMEAMAQHMLSAFEHEGETDMLLVFETDKTSEAGAGLSMDSVKAQSKALANVRNYVVANAPGQAGGIVETMGSIMPVEAKSFETEAEALEWLRSQPRLAA